MHNYAFLASNLNIVGFIQADELRARCPLHDDQNPSFSLNINTGLWTCFAGCGKGNFVHIVERILGCSLQEAYDWIANNGRQTSTEQIIKELAIEFAAPSEVPQSTDRENWLELFKSLDNKIMPLWFLERGFSWKTVNAWNIRYNPLMDSIVIPVYWDKQLVGTVTRNTREGWPRYQNSANFPRAEVLLGEIFTSKSDIIICEGALDVLWLWQCGYNAAAILGSHISHKQIDILRRYRFGEIILALDNDEAGKEGTKQVQELLLNKGWLATQISQIRFPEGIKDPQDCTEEVLDELYKNRKGIYEFIT